MIIDIGPLSIEKAIKLMKVWKEYIPGNPVLKGISLEVKRGEFVSIRGRSGAGKSTLLAIIGLLEKPSSGTVIIFGKDASNISDEEASSIRLRKIGFIFQSFNLIESLNVLENVELPMALAGIDSKTRRRRAMELLAKFNMDRLAWRMPWQLSVGERQRVAVVRALANNPELILADEPTSSLDEENSEIVLDLLQKINKDKLTTIVLTSTNLEERLPTHRDYLLRNGRLIRIK